MSGRPAKFIIASITITISIFLFYISNLATRHLLITGIPALDWITESNIIGELAGSFFVIPIVYIFLESVTDERFKKEIRAELRDFIAEPTSIIPHIEADKLDGFTSILLNKLFFNDELSVAFVNSINKHKNRYSRPIRDYRVRCFISSFSEAYFKIEATITTNRRNLDARNVSCACVMGLSSEKEIFSIDSFDERFDFVWRFVCANNQSKIEESKFSVKSVKIAGEKLQTTQTKADGRISVRSEEMSKPIDDDSLVEIDFVVLQRKSVGGVSFGISRPAESVTIEINYSNTSIKNINVWSYLIGADIVEPYIKRDYERKIVEVRYDDWVFIGSGLVFTWIEDRDPS